MASDKLSIVLKLTIAAIAISAALAGGYVYRDRGCNYDQSSRVVATNPGVPISQPSQQPQVALPDFADIVAQQGPAVVNVSVSGTIKGAIANLPDIPQLDPNDPFFEFFRRFHIPMQPQGDIPTHGLGSGFILNSEGVILTNAHVVADADEVTVKLTDKREFKAKVIGIDKPSDIAVLKVNAQNLPTVKIGDPQQVRVGNWVLAIGSPFGFENSVTAGIISAKSRSLPDESYVPFLQTDVAVNPGNSGGPLFNIQGEVIGINSQIYSQSGGYQGLSFAIPIDVAMKVEQQLMAHGKVSRGRLGISIQELNQQLANSFGLANASGALVSSVENGGPAEKAGIEPGDVIIKFNNKSIEKFGDLPPLVADVSPGKSAKVEVWHQGKEKTVTVTIGEMKTYSSKDESSSPSKDMLGLMLRPISPDEKKSLNVEGGLYVEKVVEGAAARAGIRPGDVILSVNSEKVFSVEGLRSLVEKNHKHLALLVLRGNSRIFVPIQLG